MTVCNGTSAKKICLIMSEEAGRQLDEFDETGCSDLVISYHSSAENPCNNVRFIFQASGMGYTI